MSAGYLRPTPIERRKGDLMKWIMFMCLIFSASCATVHSTRIATAGYVGCPVEEIELYNYNPMPMGAGASWLAECRGKSFFCTERSNWFYGTASISCKEGLQP